MSTVRIEVTDQRIADLLCSAFEGGSNYWYEIVSYVKPSEISFLSSPDLNGGKPFPHIDYPLNPGGAVVVKSMEEPEKRAVRLTKGRLERALLGLTSIARNKLRSRKATMYTILWLTVNERMPRKRA